MNLEMVFSAGRMMGLAKGIPWMTRPEAPVKPHMDALCAYIDILRNECSEIMGLPFQISQLYNAYTEKEEIEFYNEHERLHMDNIFADSGGLQMVTLGKHKNKTVTEEDKAKVYEYQQDADFAFCFDEIPAVTIGSNPRSNANDRYIDPSRIDSSSIATAQNINAQAKFFEDHDARAKIFHIIQGNSIDDMVRWADVGLQHIDNKDRLAGFAMADTCMGVGVLESVDMLLAFNRIQELTDHRYKRVHLLGIGSASRLTPLLAFLNSGLIDKDITISFDSSSLSLAWMHGIFLDYTGKHSLTERHKCAEAIKTCYNELFPFIESHTGADKQKLLDFILDSRMQYVKLILGANSNDNAPAPERNAARLFIVLSCLWQTKVLCSQFVDIINSKSKRNHPALAFSRVTSYNDALKLRNDIISRLPSKRVPRVENTLDKFF